VSHSPIRETDHALIPEGGTIRPREPHIDPDVFWGDRTMRRVRIIERPANTYTYAAVDRDTGEIPPN